MSGGLFDYLDTRIEYDIIRVIPGDTAERVAFKNHLRKVVEALHAIDYNVSGDRVDPEGEKRLILECLGSYTPVLEAMVGVAEEARDRLNRCIQEAKELYSET